MVVEDIDLTNENIHFDISVGEWPQRNERTAVPIGRLGYIIFSTHAFLSLLARAASHHEGFSDEINRILDVEPFHEDDEEVYFELGFDQQFVDSLFEYNIIYVYGDRLKLTEMFYPAARFDLEEVYVENPVEILGVGAGLLTIAAIRAILSFSGEAELKLILRFKKDFGGELESGYEGEVKIRTAVAADIEAPLAPLPQDALMDGLQLMNEFKRPD